MQPNPVLYTATLDGRRPRPRPHLSIKKLLMTVLAGFVVGLLIVLGIGAAMAQEDDGVWYKKRFCRHYAWDGSCAQRGWRWAKRSQPYHHHYRDTGYRNGNGVRHYRSRIEDDIFDGDRNSWNRRDPDTERGISCLLKPGTDRPKLVRVVGAARLSEKAAMDAAIRQWQSAVAFDDGEKYMELETARYYHWRCTRASSNESAIGKAGEAILGDAAVQRKCVVIAQPCLPAMKSGDRDDKDR